MPTVRKRVLITVKTYPNPSSKYDETVCTAGIDLDSGGLMRLYPVRFRHLKFEDQFKKWDIVELDVEHKSSDARGDTWTPIGAEYQLIGHIGTGKGKPPDWAERCSHVLLLVSTVEELQDAARDRSCSLGVVRVYSAATPLALYRPPTSRAPRVLSGSRFRLVQRNQVPLRLVAGSPISALRALLDRAAVGEALEGVENGVDIAREHQIDRCLPSEAPVRGAQPRGHLLGAEHVLDQELEFGELAQRPRRGSANLDTVGGVMAPARDGARALADDRGHLFERKAERAANGVHINGRR